MHRKELEDLEQVKESEDSDQVKESEDLKPSKRIRRFRTK